MRGLVVGEDTLNRNLFRAALELLSIPCAAAASIGQGRSALSATHADLVVVVEHENHGDGLDWVRELRQHGWGGRVVYAASLVSDPHLDELANSLQVPTVMLEPYELTEVVQHLQSTLVDAVRGAVNDEGQYPQAWSGTLARVREEFGQTLASEVDDVVADVEGGVTGASPSVRATVGGSWRLLARRCADMRFTVVAELLQMSAEALCADAAVMDTARLESACVLMHTWAHAWGPRRASVSPSPRQAGTALCVSADRALLVALADWFDLHGLDMINAGSMVAARALARTTSIEYALIADDLPDDGAQRLVELLHGQESTSTAPIGLIAEDTEAAADLERALRHERLSGVITLPLQHGDLAALVRRLSHSETTPAVRVLVLSADPTFLAEAGEALTRASCEVAQVLDPMTLDAQVLAFEPHVVVSDVLLPGMSGLDVCRRLHAGIQRSSLPVLLAVEHDSAPLQIAMARAGVFGTVMRPVRPDEIVAKVLAANDRVSEIEDRDPTTGTLRRNAFHRRLRDLMRRSAPDVAVGLIDLDYFHDVNHMYGFDAGDKVLVGLVACVRQAFDEEALVGRWGSDRIVVALARETRTGAQARLTSALSTFGSLVFSGKGGARFRVSAQVGVAASGRHMCGADELMLEAEDALTAVKEHRAAS